MDTEIAAAVAQIPPQVHTDDIVEARHRTAGLIAMLHAASQAGLPPS